MTKRILTLHQKVWAFPVYVCVSEVDYTRLFYLLTTYWHFLLMKAKGKVHGCSAISTLISSQYRPAQYSPQFRWTFTCPKANGLCATLLRGVWDTGLIFHFICWFKWFCAEYVCHISVVPTGSTSTRFWIHDKRSTAEVCVFVLYFVLSFDVPLVKNEPKRKFVGWSFFHSKRIEDIFQMYC